MGVCLQIFLGGGEGLIRVQGRGSHWEYREIPERPVNFRNGLPPATTAIRFSA